MQANITIANGPLLSPRLREITSINNVSETRRLEINFSYLHKTTQLRRTARVKSTPPTCRVTVNTFIFK